MSAVQGDIQYVPITQDPNFSVNTIAIFRLLNLRQIFTSNEHRNTGQSTWMQSPSVTNRCLSLRDCRHLLTQVSSQETILSWIAPIYLVLCRIYFDILAATDPQLCARSGRGPSHRLYWTVSSPLQHAVATTSYFHHRGPRLHHRT